jgi:hypothetical protein
MTRQEQRREAMKHGAAAAEHCARLERLERLELQAHRARVAEMRDVAVEVIGVPPTEVARALRGVLTEQDER